MLEREQQRRIEQFLEQYFGKGFHATSPTREEGAVMEQVVSFVTSRFSDAKYILGLALDFSLLAQILSLEDPKAKGFRKGLDRRRLFETYTLVTKRGKRSANTLTLEYRGRKHGIRKIEEQIVDLFINLERPGYPSAYVYNTGQWQKFQDNLLVPCFSLSESARLQLCKRLIEFGMENLTQGTPIGRITPRVRLFDLIVASYPRIDAKENAGTVMQGIAAGFFKADRPHLYLIVDKTRTGSARQARIGDIDGYLGLDLEVSIEVKDHPLTRANVTKEIGEFLDKIQRNRIQGIVLCRHADDDAEAVARASGATSLSLSELLRIIETWDWPKQDAGVNGLLHYLAHVEQNPDAVDRLLEFISVHDRNHDSLTFRRETE